MKSQSLKQAALAFGPPLAACIVIGTLIALDVRRCEHAVDAQKREDACEHLCERSYAYRYHEDTGCRCITADELIRLDDTRGVWRVYRLPPEGTP